MIGALMDYSKLTDTILAKVLAVMALINNPEIDPETRQLNQEILFSQVGAAVYAKVYDMNAFDYEIEHTTGPGIDDRHYGLAKVASGSISTGAVGLSDYVRNYIDGTIAKAQQDATTNAHQSGKHPTVRRSVNGETCKWCNGLAGEYTNPPNEVYRRHRGCDCSIVTQGFRSRNGQLANYIKPKDR